MYIPKQISEGRSPENIGEVFRAMGNSFEDSHEREKGDIGTHRIRENFSYPAKDIDTVKAFFAEIFGINVIEVSRTVQCKFCISKAGV